MFDLFGNLAVQNTEPLGLPYMGSKRKYADKLICKMLEIKPNSKYFYDLFGGGGAMSFAALQKGMTVVYNEKQIDLVNFIKFIFDCVRSPQSEYGIFPEQYYQFITREDFMWLKHESGNYAQFARICYSFGNNQRGYMFNPELEKTKHLAHNLVVFRDLNACKQLNEVLGAQLTISNKPTLYQRRLDFYKAIRMCQRFDLEQLQQLEQLEQLQQLERKITFLNFDYRQVEICTPISETIIYLDPPYRGTAKYIEGLNHDDLDAWFATLPSTAFMSEYSAPFKSVCEIQTRSTLSPISNTCKKIEKLFINQPI